MYFPLFVGDPVSLYGLVCINFCHFLFRNHLEEEERSGCFAFIVLGMSCYCKFFVALPHDAVGSSAVCDCSISRLNLLTFFTIKRLT